MNVPELVMFAAEPENIERFFVVVVVSVGVSASAGEIVNGVPGAVGRLDESTRVESALNC